MHLSILRVWESAFIPVNPVGWAVTMAAAFKTLTGVRCPLIRFSLSKTCSSLYTSTTSTTTRNMSNDGPIQIIPFTKDFLFRQLFDTVSSTYTYLLADAVSKKAILIDPVIELAERDRQVVKDLGLDLLYVINTHMHADHITGTGLLKKIVPGCKSVISERAGAKADIYIKEGDEIKFGRHALQVLATPGHTCGCVTYYIPEQGAAFTGDALLVRGCGRTDFQEGDPATLYNSVHKKIFTMPAATRVFPAHDYKGNTMTTVGEEQRLNPRLTKTLDQFVELMNNLNLAYPKMIDQAIPANKVCGIYE